MGTPRQQQQERCAADERGEGARWRRGCSCFRHRLRRAAGIAGGSASRLRLFPSPLQASRCVSVTRANPSQQRGAPLGGGKFGARRSALAFGRGAASSHACMASVHFGRCSLQVSPPLRVWLRMAASRKLRPGEPAVTGAPSQQSDSMPRSLRACALRHSPAWMMLRVCMFPCASSTRLAVSLRAGLALAGCGHRRSDRRRPGRRGCR